MRITVTSIQKTFIVIDVCFKKDEFVKQVEERSIDEGGTIEIFRDKEDRENPLDREEITDVVNVEGVVKGFNTILSGLAADKIKGMKVVRVPFLEEKALPLLAGVKENAEPKIINLFNELIQKSTSYSLKYEMILTFA